MTVLPLLASCNTFGWAVSAIIKARRITADQSERIERVEAARQRIFSGIFDIGTAACGFLKFARGMPIRALSACGQSFLSISSIAYLYQDLHDLYTACSQKEKYASILGILSDVAYLLSVVLFFAQATTTSITLLAAAGFLLAIAKSLYC